MHMPDPKGDKLFVNTAPSQARLRLKGFGHGVRKVQSAGRNQAVVIHTATGRHLQELKNKFADVGFSNSELSAESPPNKLEILPKNLFADLPVNLPQELVQDLVASGHVRIERIVSEGHASPEGFWYDQDEAEFVLLLKGATRLRFEGDDQPLEMKPGDFIEIPPHRKHRVDWTKPDEPTIWLAVYYA
jgi:cupin 2 domain-containing protein